MPDTFYEPEPRSPSTELADDIDHLETAIPVLNPDVFPDPPNLATIGAGYVGRSVEDSGTATSGGGTTLEDTTKAWEVDDWAEYIVRINSGTGAGQWRIIESNTADTLTVTIAWDTNPDATSEYDILSKTVEPLSETILYTGKAVGALTGVTRGYEPEHSSRAWDGGTPISRVLTAQDITALQNRVTEAESDIDDLEATDVDHDTQLSDLTDNQETILDWLAIRSVWGAI